MSATKCINNGNAIMMFRSTLGAVVFLSLFGCASSGSQNVEQKIASNAREFIEYDVEKIEGNKFSEAQQLGFLMTLAKPYGPNNLDEYADGYINWSRKTNQVLNSVGMSIGSISPLTGWTAILGNVGNGVELSGLYEGNRLFIITPVTGIDDCHSENSTCSLGKILKQNAQTLTNIVEYAYQNDANVKRLSSFEPVKKGMISGNYAFMNKVVVAPFSGEGNDLAYCTKPQHQAILDKVEKEGKPQALFPLGASCYALIDNYGNVFKNVKSENAYLPNGDILIQAASLPDYFPIEHLKIEQSNVFLYQPSIKYLMDDNKSEFNSLKNEAPALVDQQLQMGRFSGVPIITQLSTGKVINFGVKK
jgi:hypothetical protein